MAKDYVSVDKHVTIVKAEYDEVQSMQVNAGARSIRFTGVRELKQLVRHCPGAHVHVLRASVAFNFQTRYASSSFRFTNAAFVAAKFYDLANLRYMTLESKSLNRTYE